MDSVRKFLMFGPDDSLQRLNSVIVTDTKPQYTFQYLNESNKDKVCVFTYEEHQKLINSSTTVTLVLLIKSERLEIDFIVTGGRMGFRGSSYSNDTAEALIQDTVYDFLIDFSRRHGLSMQETKASEDSETDA